VLPFAWKWIILHTQHCACIPSQLSHLMMLHVQGVPVPFSLACSPHAFNLLGPVCAKYVIRLTSFIQYKAWRIKFYFIYHLSPLSTTFGMCHHCLFAYSVLPVFSKNWHAADSLSTWNQYKWTTMHHTSLNLLFSSLLLVFKLGLLPLASFLLVQNH
jgi:hypothetical protein